MTQVASNAHRVEIVPAPTGGTLQQTLNTMGNNTWFNMTMGGLNTALVTDEGGSVYEYGPRGHHDAAHQVVQFIGEAHASAITGAKHITYTEATNQWTTQSRAPEPGNSPTHTYYHVALNPATGDLYKKDWDTTINKKAWGSGSWTPVAPVTEPPFAHGIGLATMDWMPSLNGGSGGLVIAQTWGVGTSNAAVSQWTRRSTGEPLSNIADRDGASAYSHEDGKVYFGGGLREPGFNSRLFFRMNADGTYTSLAECPVNFMSDTSNGGPLITGPRGKVIAIGYNQAIWEYTAGTNSWTQIGTVPGPYTNDGKGFAVGLPAYNGIMIVHDLTNPICSLWKRT